MKTVRTSRGDTVTILATNLHTNGDLGHNVIYQGGSYTDFLDISRPFKIEQATLTVLFLHYDSPEVPVDVIPKR